MVALALSKYEGEDTKDVTFGSCVHLQRGKGDDAEEEMPDAFLRVGI